MRLRLSAQRSAGLPRSAFRLTSPGAKPALVYYSVCRTILCVLYEAASYACITQGVNPLRSISLGLGQVTVVKTPHKVTLLGPAHTGRDYRRISDHLGLRELQRN
jgi:hypothetical protein